MFDNMWKVKINALDMWVLGSDQVEGDSKAPANIDKRLLNLLKTLVGGLQDFVEHNCGVVDHGLVEYLVEPGILPWVLERVHPMNLVKWNSPFRHRPF